MATPIHWVPFEDRGSLTRRGPHSMTGKILHWPYCKRCGLIALKNDTTKRALRKVCEWIEDK